MSDLPTLTQLRCLVAIADTLHFGAAADSCGISQPGLSAQLTKLERLLGVPLVERTTRRVTLTAAGATVVGHARGVVEQLEELVGSVEQLRQPLNGPLHLGVIPTVAPYLLPPVLSRLRARHPDLQLILHEQQTANLIDSLRSNRIDVALLALPVDVGGTSVLEIGDEPFQLVVPHDHRLARRKSITQSDLAHEEVLLLEDGHCLRDQALAVCSLVGAPESGLVRASSISTLVQMVANGLGVTLLPSSAVKVETRGVRDVAAVPFRGDKPSRTLGMMIRNSFHRADDLELLRQMFVREIG